MSYLNERLEELDSDCVFSTGSLLRYSSSNNGPSPSSPSSNIHGRLGAAFRPRSSTDSIPFVDADISSSPGQTRESGSRQRPPRVRAASSSEDDATFVQRRSPQVKPSPLRYLNKRHSTGSQVSKLHSSFGDIDDTTSLNNLLDALDDLEDDFRCVSEDSVDCCDFVDVMSMPRGQLWTQSTGRLTGNNNNNAPHVRYNDIHSNSLQRPSPSIQNTSCLVKPAVHSGVKIAEKSSIIVSNHNSCVTSPEALQSSSSHVGSYPQSLVQTRAASGGYVQQRQTGVGQWNGKPRVGSKMPCVVSGDSVHSHLSCGSNRVQQIAGDRARSASLRPSNSVNSHVSFHLPSPTQRNKDSDWNHCPALTPPSSPLDLSPPGPALASAHYISSLRASSRRGGGASPDKERDPLARLLRFLRAFYRELAGRDPANPPPWAPPLPSGTLCPAHFQPALQLAPLGGRSDNEPRDSIRLDQILSAVRTSEGVVHEAPRRVVVEGAPGSGKTTLALRLLYSWATQDDWLGPSIQLALFIPLRELRGNTLAHYLSKELLPKSALGTTYSNNGFAHVWKCLGLLEDRLLFVLDGYDEALSGQDKGGQDKGGREALGDAIELLEGRLFPECRILVTCCPGWSSELIPLVQRRVVLHGLDWPHVERLAMAYFDGNKQPESANRFLEVVGASTQVLRPLACWPLGWLLLCVLYEETGGHIPSDTLDVHQALFKCLIRRSLSNKGDILMSSSSTQDLPGHCKKLLAEFGKLALSCIKEDRFLYTDAEIRLHCRGGGLEVTELGFLTRGLNFGRSHGQKKRAEYYTPLLRTFAEFLAAYYISSVVHYANILKRELEDLPGLSNCGGAPPDHGTVLILRFLMGLLARKGHLVFNQLCPLDFPTRTLFMLLQAAGPGEANVAAVCRLLGASSGGFFGIGITGSVSKIPVPLVHTAPLELEGWAHVLRSETCSLEALELVYQFDKGADCEELLDVFFAALAANDSVRLVRISSLLGHEFTAAEVARLAAYVKTTLPKSRLHTFELVITCLEDSAHDRFQSLVTALCDGLTDGASPSLNKLVLDLNLGTSQVVQLCAALELATQVSVLHLPHLGCGRDGLRAIARLIRARPLVALNLAGSWGMRRDDPPSSSGVSVGSGSGSSGVNTLQHGGKQASTTSSISPKTSTSSYYFSSLPRGVMGAYNSLSRPATLPRQPLQQILDGYGNGGDSKRNSDSVLFQRLFHPLPACDPAAHSGSGFHDVFEAAREPNCKLRSLNVSKCILEAEDALCLGETVRRSLCLDALRLEGGTRLGEVLPVLLGLADNTSLQLLDLGSQRLILEDGPTQLVCQSLAKNSSLRLLSLDGWTFRIEEEGSLAVFLVFLQTTSVRDLVLANCRLHLAIHDGRLSRLGRHDDSVAELLTFLPDFQCPSVVFLRLGGFQVTVNDRMALRGPHLLPFLKGFSHLSDLDLSLDKNTSGSANSNPLLIDDKVLISFFQTLSTSFRTLQSLKMSHWKICLDDSERTLRTMGRALKTCSLSYLKVNGLGVTDGSHKGALEHLFLQTVVANLSYLSWLSMVGVALTTGQAASLAKCIRDRFPGTVLELTAKDVGSDAVKTLVAVAEEGNKVEVIYMGGPSCNLRIHRLMKNHKLRGKFRRFTSLKE